MLGLKNRTHLLPPHQFPPGHTQTCKKCVQTHSCLCTQPHSSIYCKGFWDRNTHHNHHPTPCRLKGTDRRWPSESQAVLFPRHSLCNFCEHKSICRFFILVSRMNSHLGALCTDICSGLKICWPSGFQTADSSHVTLTGGSWEGSLRLKLLLSNLEGHSNSTLSL